MPPISLPRVTRATDPTSLVPTVANRADASIEVIEQVLNAEVAEGAAAALGARLDEMWTPSLTAGTTVTDTTDTTVSKSVTIPAEVLEPGLKVVVDAEADCASVDGTPTCISELRFGDASGEVITSSGARNLDETKVRNNHATIIIESLGETGVVRCYGWSNTDAVNTQSPAKRVTLDLSAGLTIAACLKWSAAHADNQAAYDGLHYQLVRPA